MKTEETEIMVRVPFEDLYTPDENDWISIIDKDNPTGVSFPVTAPQIAEIRKAQRYVVGWNNAKGRSLALASVSLYWCIEDEVNLTMNGYAFYPKDSELEIGDGFAYLNLYHYGLKNACVRCNVTGLLDQAEAVLRSGANQKGGCPCNQCLRCVDPD